MEARFELSMPKDTLNSMLNHFDWYKNILNFLTLEVRRLPLQEGITPTARFSALSSGHDRPSILYLFSSDFQSLPNERIPKIPKGRGLFGKIEYADIDISVKRPKFITFKA